MTLYLTPTEIRANFSNNRRTFKVVLSYTLLPVHSSFCCSRPTQY